VKMGRLIEEIRRLEKELTKHYNLNKKKVDLLRYLIAFSDTVEAESKQIKQDTKKKETTKKKKTAEQEQEQKTEELE